MSTPARVQRPVSEWPTLHLEPDIPAWRDLFADGFVRHPRRFDAETLETLGVVRRTIPVHCVWGWSRPEVEWEGIEMAAVLSLVEPEGRWVTIEAASGLYSSCLPIEDAARGLLAWGRDGARLAPLAGGPLRYVAPSDYWGYKGVKWVSRLRVVDAFVPGFWERRVADGHGRVPEGLVSTPTTVEQIAGERQVQPRDCRDCTHFEAQGDGLGYGWCRAHTQFVKLPVSGVPFWSQCQFKALSRDR